MGAMNIKSSLGLAVVLILIAAGVYHFAKNTTPITTELAENQPLAYSWNFTDNGYSETTGGNTTTVTLTVNGQAHNVGTYNGSCAELGAQALDENQTTGVLCWWAGAGDEIGIFAENGKLVVKRGEHGEPTAETPAFRGNFETLIELQ